MDLRVIPFPEGFVRVESDENHTVISTIKDMRLNFAMMPLQNLHALHYGVLEELGIREQWNLTIVSEFKVNNEQMFMEKTQALKENEL